MAKNFFDSPMESLMIEHGCNGHVWSTMNRDGRMWALCGTMCLCVESAKQKAFEIGPKRPIRCDK